MKSIQFFLILLLFSSASITLYAQKGIRIGIRAGLNAATTSSGFGSGTSF